MIHGTRRIFKAVFQSTLFYEKKKTWAMKQSHNETLRTTKISGEVLLEDQERKEF